MRAVKKIKDARLCWVSEKGATWTTSRAPKEFLGQQVRWGDKEWSTKGCTRKGTVTEHCTNEAP